MPRGHFQVGRRPQDDVGGSGGGPEVIAISISRSSGRGKGEFKDVVQSVCLDRDVVLSGDPIGQPNVLNLDVAFVSLKAALMGKRAEELIRAVGRRRKVDI